MGRISVQSLGQRNRRKFFCSGCGETKKKTEELKNKRDGRAWAKRSALTLDRALALPFSSLSPAPPALTDLEHSAKPYTARTVTGIQYAFVSSKGNISGLHIVYLLERRCTSLGRSLQLEKPYIIFPLVSILHPHSQSLKEDRNELCEIGMRALILIYR